MNIIIDMYADIVIKYRQFAMKSKNLSNIEKS